MFRRKSGQTLLFFQRVIEIRAVFVVLDDDAAFRRKHALRFGNEQRRHADFVFPTGEQAHDGRLGHPFRRKHHKDIMRQFFPRLPFAQFTVQRDKHVVHFFIGHGKEAELSVRAPAMRQQLCPAERLAQRGRHDEHEAQIFVAVQRRELRRHGGNRFQQPVSAAIQADDALFPQVQLDRHVVHIAECLAEFLRFITQIVVLQRKVFLARFHRHERRHAPQAQPHTQKIVVAGHAFPHAVIPPMHMLGQFFRRGHIFQLNAAVVSRVTLKQRALLLNIGGIALNPIIFVLLHLLFLEALVENRPEHRAGHHRGGHAQRAAQAGQRPALRNRVADVKAQVHQRAKTHRQRRADHIHQRQTLFGAPPRRRIDFSGADFQLVDHARRTGEADFRRSGNRLFRRCALFVIILDSMTGNGIRRGQDAQAFPAVNHRQPPEEDDIADIQRSRANQMTVDKHAAEFGRILQFAAPFRKHI